MCTLQFSLFVLCCCVLVNVLSFNLDTDDYIRYSGDNDTMFGFSVAAHRSRNHNWVIVGAPQAQTSQPGVIRGGSVYRCPTDRDENCQQLQFDSNGNHEENNRQLDEKSRQWFGATVNSGGPDQPIVACAPRYHWFTTSYERRDPVGTCYVSKGDFSSFLEFSPCRTRHWGYHRQGTCQAGLGAAVANDGDRLFIGAPGSWYWQGQLYSVNNTVKLPYVPPGRNFYGEGQMYSVDPDTRFPYTPPRFSNYGAGQVFSQKLKDRAAVLFTKEGSAVDDDSYMGYSVTVGNFTGGKYQGVAAGMPRGSKLHGKVLLYTWDLVNHQNITGSQLGAYFGYAITAADVNGDGLDDLIVGAPLHTEPNNEGKYEVGRLYVIYPVKIKDDRNAKPDAKWPTLSKFSIRDGVYSKGRFGLSVACLGDLDLDGYQDIAVGAPYAGARERGAVYIYYGSATGIHEKASQVIFAEDVSQSGMYTFGFSLAGAGIDLDNNLYPDMVVGAYLSNRAFVFRSRPVVNVDAYVKFNTKFISLEERACQLSNGKLVSCTQFEACAKYSGIGLRDEITLNMQYILDARNSKDHRMFLYPQERQYKFNETWTLTRNELRCAKHKVYIKENIRDKLTPLEVTMTYEIAGQQRQHSYIRRDPRSALRPVLNSNRPLVHNDTAVIRKNCGADEICIPNLRLITKPNVEKYLYGSNKKLEIDVKVLNEGEDSFESMFYMKLPAGINFFNTERIDSDRDMSVKCSPPTESTNHTLKCDIGNPLPSGKLAHFKVLLDPYSMEGMNPSYDFVMQVNSTNPEEDYTMSDNFKQLSIDIWVKTNLSLTGWAQSPDVHYKESQYKEGNYTIETDIGPQIVHFYSIKNHGPSDINEAEVVFLWPDTTLGGDDMLYLMEQPETSGNIRCEFAHANELKVDLLPKKSILESSGLKSYHETESRFTSSYGKDSVGTIGSDSGIKTEVQTSSVSVQRGGTVETDHKKIVKDDKIDEGGDASQVHERRNKESSQGATGGGGVTTQTQTFTTNWNSSSTNGGPVQTHSWNRSSVTGSDGVTRFTETSGGQHGNADRNKQTIYYTSTMDKSRGGQAAGSSFSVTGQGTDQSISGQRSTGNVGTGQNNAGGQFESEYNSQSGSQGSRQSGQSGYFNWDRTNGNRNSESGQQGFNSQGIRTQDGSSTSTQQGSGSQGFRTQEFGGSSSSSQQGSGSQGFRNQEFGRSSTSTQQGSGSQGFRTQGSSGSSTQHQASGGSSQQQGSRNSNSGTISSSGEMIYAGVSGGNIGSDHRTMHTMAGQNVNGLISDDDLRRMFEQGSGDFRNESHYIQWSTDGNRVSFRVQKSGGIQKPFSIATEEFVNQGIDDYTRSVTHSGVTSRSGGHAQGSSNSQGSAHGQESTDAQGGTFGQERTHSQGSVQSRGGAFGQERTHSQGSTNSQGNTYSQGSSFGKEQTHSQAGSNTQESSQTHNQGSRTATGRDRSTYGKYDQSNYDATAGLGSAALGTGFRTTSLDLGALNPTVDDNQSGHVEASYEDTGSQYYDPDLGSYEDRSKASAGGQGRVSYDSSRVYSGERQRGGQYGTQSSRTHESHQTGGGEGGNFESHSSSSSHRSSASGTRQFVGDNVPTEYPSDTDHRNRLYRNKRDASIDDIIQCKATNCKVLRCTAGPLTKDEEAWTALRFRANAETFRTVAGTQQVTFSTMMLARINKLPYIGTPNDRPVHTHEIFTTVTLTETEIKPDVVPLWVVVLSACAGAIILLLLIFLLYKCGFFKRNRPTDSPERQPLNRNGYYQGDEQL